jgi:N6-L-threonylcarbamoyladenine synthase
MNVLGIETSCDETAAAVVAASSDSGIILSNVVHSQIKTHAEYGGVVPEIAARAHESLIFPVIREALDVAQVSFNDINAIAATCGPGLIGGVMVGAVAAKMLAIAYNKPFVAVNHLEGHAHVCRISENVTFPYLLLLISGGHCQLLEVYGLGEYKLLGNTLDDSVGEAFDKVARLIGLPYPGGPNIEHRAKAGDPDRFGVTIPLKGRAGCDFSFSGLKTAFRVIAQKIVDLSEQDVNDFAASLQKSIVCALSDRVKNAFEMLSPKVKASKTFVVAGGVAANKAVCNAMIKIGEDAGFRVFVPSMGLCTDNAAMIAWVGLEYHVKGVASSLFFEPRSRWEL